MNSKENKTLVRITLIIILLQIRCFVFTQTVLTKSSYIFTFSPVYSSGLVDMSFITFEDIYLVVSDSPIKIDSAMSVLSKKNYSSLSRILDTLRRQFKVYRIVENNSKEKKQIRLNRMLTDYNKYKTGYLFSLNDSIKKYSSVVGYVIHRYTFLEEGIRYKVLNENCGDFPTECNAIITNLQ